MPPKKVTFYSMVIMVEFVDDYDRSSVPCASLSAKERAYMLILRDLMKRGQYISDNPLTLPVEEQNTAAHTTQPGCLK
jgi:hypothetical protein